MARTSTRAGTARARSVAIAETLPEAAVETAAPTTLHSIKTISINHTDRDSWVEFLDKVIASQDLSQEKLNDSYLSKLQTFRGSREYSNHSRSAMLEIVYDAPAEKFIVVNSVKQTEIRQISDDQSRSYDDHSRCYGNFGAAPLLDNTVFPINELDPANQDFWVIKSERSNGQQTYMFWKKNTHAQHFFIASAHPANIYIDGAMLESIFTQLIRSVSHGRSEETYGSPFELPNLREIKRRPLLKLCREAIKKVERLKTWDPSLVSIRDAKMMLPGVNAKVIPTTYDRTVRGGHNGAIYYTNSVGEVFYSLINQSRPTYAEGSTLQSAIRAFFDTFSVSDKARKSALKRVIKKVNNYHQEKVREAEHEYKIAKERYMAKPRDFSAYIAAGFEVLSYNEEDGLLQLKYVMRDGYTFLDRFIVPGTYTFKLTIGLASSRPEINMEVKCDEYTRFHPHIRETITGSYASCCMGDFGTAYIDAFLSGDPQELILQLNLYMNACRAGNYFSGPPRTMSWSHVMDKVDMRLVSKTAVEDYMLEVYCPDRGITPESSYHEGYGDEEYDEDDSEDE